MLDLPWDYWAKLLNNQLKLTPKGFCMSSLEPPLAPYVYIWPLHDINPSHGWVVTDDARILTFQLPESEQELSTDSRWPALYPSAMSLVTTGLGEKALLERVVGPCLVNRFPFIMALSFCREELSSRHYPRTKFIEALEASCEAAVQFLPPGKRLDAALGAITTLNDANAHLRITASGLESRPGLEVAAPVFKDSYLVYETRLVSPGRDMLGNEIFAKPYQDVGSHRVYFLEVRGIQLRQDIAHGKRQIAWRSLPAFQGEQDWSSQAPPYDESDLGRASYIKGFIPNYRFPAAGTIGFEHEEIINGMAIRRLPSEAADQVEIDNDKARWPCFFPSSLGMITSWGNNGRPDAMPCGSVAMFSRQPLIIGAAICYVDVNDRYYRRRTLDNIRSSGVFGCGVPYIEDNVLKAIAYTGNISMAADADKVAHAGLAYLKMEGAPLLPSACPVHFDCRVVGETPLGTHSLILGEVQRIHVRSDVSPDNPLEWCGWSADMPVKH